MGKFNDERLNISGKRDTTAYLAVQNIRRDERKNLILKLKALANSYGYRIVSTIRLKELESEECEKQ